MKKLLIIPILFLFNSSFAQSVSVPPVSFSTVADLRLQVGTPKVQVLLLGLSTPEDGNGGIYRWSPDNTGTDDGFLVVKVTNVTTGRWMRVSNGNTIKGSVTFSAVTLQTAYPVLYRDANNTPIVLPFIPVQVYVQARTAQAAVPSWISNITASGFTVNFSTVPLLGTLNLTVDYLILKQ